MIIDTMAEAKLYASLGWRVLPCHNPTAGGGCSCGKSTCKKPGKHPRISEWQNKASSDPQQIELWWQTWPEANVGVRLGPASNLIDIEYDSDEGKATADELLEFVATARYRSHRSTHHLFTFPTGLAIPTAVVAWRGLEIRFGTDKAGAQSIFPPSLHTSGQRYQWLNHPSEFRPAAPPQWLAEAIAPAQRPVVATMAAGFTMAETLDNAPGYAEGNRHRKLLELVGRELGLCGVSPDVAHKALAWNLRNAPPLPESEVLGVVDKLAQRETVKPSRLVASASQPIVAAGTPPTLVLPSATASLVTRMGRDIQPEELAWLWPGRIPIGKLTLIVGMGESGKTFICCDLMARLSRDAVFADGTRGVVAASALATAEDGLSDTIRPRMDAHGADLNKWHSIDLVRVGDRAAALSFDQHLPVLEAWLTAHPEVKLLVVDPLPAFLGKVNSHVDAEVRTVLTPLKQLAEEKGVAVVGIMHLSKSNDRSVAQRVSGSIAFLNAARVVWSVSKDPDDPTEQRRLMTRVKGNIAGVAQTGLAFVLNEQGVVEWDPEPIYVSANEVESDLKLDRSKMNAAIDLLQAELERGPRLATDIQTEANRHAVSKRTLHRAKGEIGVLAYQQGRKWWWALPGQVPEQSLPQEPAKVYRFDDGGNLLGESEVAQ
jgi:putative DNA primase/helicase